MNMPAGVFKAKCLKLMDEVHLTHGEVVITKYGKPVAKLVAVEALAKKPIYGFLKNSIVIKADIVGSTEEQWDADR